MRNTADVTGGKPIAILSQFILFVSNFIRLLRHPWKKRIGAILLFYPGYHSRLTSLVYIVVDLIYEYTNIIKLKSLFV
jgi:hypothetical protein